jgi:AcrR family transcriptional regulator
MAAARPTTRERLLAAASQLFAHNGYRGAPVRDICNLAHANPGAVSYHFGGKRQLYRAVLRRAAQALASSLQALPPSPALAATGGAQLIRERLRVLYATIRDNPTAARLVLRDLGDGGAVALEALAPTLRAAVAALDSLADLGEAPQAAAAGRLLLLELAAPLFLLTAAWPVLEGALELDPSQCDQILDQMLEAVLAGRSQHHS